MHTILFISNMSNRINSFSAASIETAKKLNLEFHYASNWKNTVQEQIAADEEKYNIKIHSIPIARNPLSKTNFKAYRELCALINRENIDYIHCNTPVGGLLGRLAGKKCSVKKVIYQAHGFHFYKGAPLLNWLLYYPIEKWLARYTDALITINHDDYNLAKTKMKLRNGGNVHYVPGVGIDLKQYTIDKSIREKKRSELGIPEDAFVLISAGELNKNKNNQVIISAMKNIESDNIHYVLCGTGNLSAPLQKQADDAGLHDRVHFLGYRSDITELYQMADCFVMPSFREGLSRSIMEAMANGLPCIVSKIRGNTDLIDEGKGGYLCAPDDWVDFVAAINAIAENEELRLKMQENNLNKIKKFDLAIVESEMRRIYEEVFLNN